METTNLRVVYNHKRGYTANTLTNKNRTTQFLIALAKRYKVWIKSMYSTLEEFGTAAGMAIRN
ncbi:hypothetical protein IWQ47_004700 [Aquimarina sp. EL_43]|uniref:hypothetical protein n=1 Tax=unclassified Aquimarina TaxID=2627091 RepID=UPI0018CBE61D|nr:MULTISPECIES: hypothetical protein [unclassified Aquimarina]MBG6133373.1 hypothetical protein [Aquimarina sp. EL_35]MBG6153448.1 hypothetical protein [Aquimarina sp. EL_32]MBG6171604.1 hypothetical protein [Aquimarina sp. EL_43]